MLCLSKKSVCTALDSGAFQSLQVDGKPVSSQNVGLMLEQFRVLLLSCQGRKPSLDKIGVLRLGF